jgi:hypothetical protein
MAPDNFVKLCRPRFTSFSPLKEVYSEAVLVATLGATGFEPHDPTAPRNERAIHNKPAFVKECVDGEAGRVRDGEAGRVRFC